MSEKIVRSHINSVELPTAYYQEFLTNTFEVSFPRSAL